MKLNESQFGKASFLGSSISLSEQLRRHLAEKDKDTQNIYGKNFEH